MQESPKQYEKEIPAFAGMTVFRTTLNIIYHSINENLLVIILALVLILMK